MTSPVTVQIKDDIGWVTINNPPVNATSTAVRAGLMEAVDRVQGCRLAVLECAGKTFVAGGDMSEFDAAPVPPHLPDVVDAIAYSATPFVALLHGNVLGGGLELAMACAFRVAKPGTKFGLPEVNVGLIPGAGGTQHTPRLLGWDMAVDMGCLGQVKTAQAVADVGGLDLITDDLHAAVPGFIGAASAPLSTRVPPPLTETERARLAAKVTKAAKGRKAPQHNFEMLQLASTPYETAQPQERALHLALRQSDESRALRHVFFAERSVTRPARLRDVIPLPIKTVAVVGGGLMGAGIAAACLNAGLRVHVIERDDAASVQARVNVTKLMQGALTRGKVTQDQFDQRLGQFDVAADYGIAADADLAIEAVFEDLDAKRAVFAALADVVRPNTLLATNTSYLNPDEIFAGIAGLDRCLGIHFFSPAHIMKLVEVVQTAQSSDTTLATGFAFAKALRKTPVLAGICDGFIGNRILSAYRRAAEYLLVDGALPQQIDAAMRDFGMAMGPFEAQDMSGLQIALANRRRQDATRDPGERYVAISDRLCALDRLGKRSGAGWYAYPDGARHGDVDPVTTQIITDYAQEQGITRRPFSDHEIQTQLLAAMANEGARIVDEGIADSDAAVDVVKTAGYGFPRHHGGPMHWAQTVGHTKITAALTALEQASPGSWTRAARYCDTSD